MVDGESKDAESTKTRPMEKICVIGAGGYIGLPLSLYLCLAGYHVYGVDVDHEKIERLTQGKIFFKEKGLQQLLDKARATGRIEFSTRTLEADAFIIAVPTPLIKKDKVADLSYVKNALLSIVPHLNPGNLVILESTVPPFTCRNLVKPLIERHTAYTVPEDILVAHCPERAFPGNLLEEFVYNDRIIGGMSPRASRKAFEIYSRFVKGTIHLTDDLTAEIVKLAENTYRDINIAYANQLATICDHLKADVNEVIRLANLHPRVHILRPGIGVGGHCIPIDPWFLAQAAKDHGELIRIARKINSERPKYIARQILDVINELPQTTPNVLILGKAYKPNVSDCRESPAIQVVEILQHETTRANLTVKDPLVDDMDNFSLADEVKGKHLVVILVPHDIIMTQLDRFKKEHASSMTNVPRIIVF